MNNKEKELGLQKSLSPMSVWAIAFGCIIGWGSFINPGKKFLPNSGVAGTAIAMVLGALVMVIMHSVMHIWFPNILRLEESLLSPKNVLVKHLHIYADGFWWRHI